MRPAVFFLAAVFFFAAVFLFAAVFCRGLCLREAPASDSAIVTACLRLLTLPAFPRGPLSRSPWAYSCITRPTVLRWDFVVLAMVMISGIAPLRSNGKRPIRLRA